MDLRCGGLGSRLGRVTLGPRDHPEDDGVRVDLGVRPGEIDLVDPLNQGDDPFLLDQCSAGVVQLDFHPFPHREGDQLDAGQGRGGYECFARCVKGASSYVQIVRWEGPLGKFTYLANKEGANYGLKDGDTLKASIVGNVITVYINGVEKARVKDDTYKTGNPGIGVFLQCDGRHGAGSNKDYGFKSFTARAIEDADQQQGETTPQTTIGGCYVARWPLRSTWATPNATSDDQANADGYQPQPFARRGG